MVLISRISVSNERNAHKQSFKGVPLPQAVIRNADDAIVQWGKLAHKKYTSLGNSYENFASNIANNEKNFSFLDALITPKEQKKFIDHFKEVTGFPDLSKVSQKIVKEFDKVTSFVEEGFKKYAVIKSDMTSIVEPHEIIFKGYNPTSSVGLGKALPGSDLNDAFLVFKGTGVPYVDNNIKRQFRNFINEQTYSRILSFNHEDAYPTIMSVSEVMHGMNEIDEVNKYLFKSNEEIRATISERMRYSLYQPGESLDGFARYNIALARSLNTSQRIFAKDLSVVLEGIRDGILIKRQEPISLYIGQAMENSTFAWTTNTLQIHAIENGLGIDIAYKRKIAEREKLRHFDEWDTAKQFKCVKNIIKHMADGSKIDNEYKPMLTNEGCPIASSINAFQHNLLNGEIFKNCIFKFFGEKS